MVRNIRRELPRRQPSKRLTLGGFGLLAFFGVFASIVVFVVGSFIAAPIISHATKDTEIVTVEDKERIVKDEDSYYLVWTQVQNEDGTKTAEVFKVTDDAAQWHFNASDTYGQLKEGQTYEVTVNGWRIPVVSEYRNILSVDNTIATG